jgi:NitT/TauT family transport system permease protein
MAAAQETVESDTRPTVRVRSRRWREVVGTASYPVSAALVALLLWEAVVHVFRIPFYILPAPSQVVQQGIEFTPRIASHYWVTLYEALLGYGIAIAIAVPAALLISYSPLLDRTIYPLVVFLDEVPKIAIAPLLITWFGFGIEPKIILTTIISLFPIFINGVAGFKSISDELVNLGRSAGAREWEMFWKIRLPNALPYLFVGLKMSGSAAVIGAVVSEFLAGDKGLGYYLLIVLGNLKMALGFAVIASMATIGLSLFFGMTLIESLTIRWHVSKRSAGRRGAFQ